MWKKYFSPNHVEDALLLLEQNPERSRIVAGATDLILELERGIKKGVDSLVDITRIGGLDKITLDHEGIIHLGPLVTHNDCLKSVLIREHALCLALACWEVGSPQIRNRGTIAGNLITASPANDTITPLMALDAHVVLRSSKAERKIPLRDFYLGVRKTVMKPDEILIDIFFKKPAKHSKSIYIKFALRRAQAISVVNSAVMLEVEDKLIKKASITLGAVAPTIIHAQEAEQFLVGKYLDQATIQEAGELALIAAKPISDIRASASYRKAIVRVIVQRGLSALANDRQAEYLPLHPVLLSAKNKYPTYSLDDGSQFDGSEIITTINNKEYCFKTGFNKSLLRLLREDAGLIGTKEGCAEGECGACTVFLDGNAVMSCMVPAPRAHYARIETIEGLADDDILHPIQRAFIDEGAVQCGYCTPGILMSAAKLLEERPKPDRNEIQQALTGNLCRCTGYYNIISAVERAASGG
jgi:xanthine dehydrogenase iron-sulfur cluster and FAD-binding subunit A